MDYGRQIYNTLQDILEFIEGWKADITSWQTSLSQMLEKSLDFLSVLLAVIAVYALCSLAMRLFFPGYRD